LEFTETSGDAGPRTSRPGFQSGAGLLASLVRCQRRWERLRSQCPRPVNL